MCKEELPTLYAKYGENKCVELFPTLTENAGRVSLPTVINAEQALILHSLSAVTYPMPTLVHVSNRNYSHTYKCC